MIVTDEAFIIIHTKVLEWKTMLWLGLHSQIASTRRLTENTIIFSFSTWSCAAGPFARRKRAFMQPSSFLESFQTVFWRHSGYMSSFLNGCFQEAARERQRYSMYWFTPQMPHKARRAGQSQHPRILCESHVDIATQVFQAPTALSQHTHEQDTGMRIRAWLKPRHSLRGPECATQLCKILSQMPVPNYILRQRFFSQKCIIWNRKLR